MFAKRLEQLLLELSFKSDVSYAAPEEFAARFEALRDYRQLPYGRERRDQQLTNSEIGLAVLGLVSSRPSWAGHAALVLRDMRPVGGLTASFFECPNLIAAITLILSDKDARGEVVKLAVTAAEMATNSNGHATLTYRSNGERREAFFVPKEAVSLLQPGREKDFDPDSRHAAVTKETTFSPGFFDRIVHEIELAKLFPVPPPGDGSEYDVEEARQARNRKLGAKPSSRFLNIPVDAQVAWPKDETLVSFDRYKLVLLPKTRENDPSIHIDLTAHRIDGPEGRTVLSRFLSMMSWCDDEYAVLQNGWSGNPVPVATTKRDLVFNTQADWMFDRHIPVTEEARRALALYREARNAQRNFMVSYAVLNYCKVIEIGTGSRGEAKNRLRDLFAAAKEIPRYGAEFLRFADICGTERPHEYLWSACRVAVAHAGKESKSDPDDSSELRRLHTAADILHHLARYFIAHELKIETNRVEVAGQTEL